MKIYEDLNFICEQNNIVATVGSFDGVHLAHKIILQRIVSIAKKIDGKSLLITFNPHPRQVLEPNSSFGVLSTKQEFINHIENIGIDILLIIPFTIEFSQMTSKDFIKNILVEKLKIYKIVIGYNHFFGKNREGNIDSLLEYSKLYNFLIEEIHEKDIENESVSSSKIRKALNSGDIKKANQYLGYNYLLNGKVEIKQSKLIFVVNNSNKIIPKDGKYNCLFYSKDKKNNIYVEIINSIICFSNINQLKNNDNLINTIEFINKI